MTMMHTAVQWEQIKRENFDRLVEILIIREHPTASVKIIDGRGGDDGKDAEVTLSDGSVIIYQLKYFPEGFTGPWVQRRPQIKRSFTSVAGLESAKWVLVSPNKFQKSEWAFLRSLSGYLPEGSQMAIEAWDQGALDNRLSRNTDLVDYIQRGDDLARLALLYQQETAAMLTPGSELPSRLQALARIVDSLDPHWTLDFARSEGMTTMSLRPKHSQATETHPVSISFTPLVDSRSPTTDAFRRVLGYGAHEPLVLSKDQFQDFKVEGTPLLDGFNPDELRLLADGIPSGSVACLLTARDEHGGRRRQFRGIITHFGEGFEGSTLDLSFHESSSTLTAWIPTAAEVGATFRMDYSLHTEPDISPRSVEASAALAVELNSAHSFELATSSGDRLLEFSGSDSGNSDTFSERQRQIQQIASDFIAVCDALHLDLLLPTQFSTRDRIMLRVARLVLEGHVTYYGREESVTVTINPSPGKGEHSKDFLEGEPGAVFFTCPLTIDFGDVPIVIDNVTFWHPSMELVDDSGETAAQYCRGEPVKLILQSADGTPMRVALPGRENVNDSPAPWGLLGIDDPAGSSGPN